MAKVKYQNHLCGLEIMMIQTDKTNKSDKTDGNHIELYSPITEVTRAIKITVAI